MVEIFVIAAVLGTIPAYIAKQKGHSFGDFWIFGTLLFIVALPVALTIKPSKKKHQQCPACRSWIDREATACARCGRDVPSPVAAT